MSNLDPSKVETRIRFMEKTQIRIMKKPRSVRIRLTDFLYHISFWSVILKSEFSEVASVCTINLPTFILLDLVRPPF